MRRRTLQVASALSFLLFLGSLCLLVQSYLARDQLEWIGHDRRSALLVWISRGCLRVHTIKHVGEGQYDASGYRFHADEPDDLTEPGPLHHVHWQLGRAGWWTTDNARDRSTVLLLPLWLIVMLFALLPARSVSRHLVIRRMRARQACGQCPICGYDLRVCHDRCPECGTRTGSKVE
jgi:hypothetical protein